MNPLDLLMEHWPDVAGASALILLIYREWRARRSAQSEAREKDSNAAQVITDAALDLIAPLREEIATLRKQVQEERLARQRELNAERQARLESERRHLNRIENLELLVLKLRRGVALLRKQVIELGAEPVFDLLSLDFEGLPDTERNHKETR